METIVRKGRIRSPADRRRRDEIGEKLRGIEKRSIEVKRQTGLNSGPFTIKDWQK